MKRLPFIFLLAVAVSCQQPSSEQTSADSKTETSQPFIWENATVYFMLTDRFNNGNEANDLSYGRQKDGGPLRSFMGGDIRGVIQKLEEGYFDSLGVTAIWMNPMIENIHGSTDEGTGKSYGFHGYWARDWTTLDKNFGTMDDYKELVDKAHERGIRIIMDVVINHTGPVTDTDSQWPDSWVRMDPTCTFQDFESTVSCTLVDNLPDILTDKEDEVELPEFLLKKWEEEGRKEQELKELDDFFERTGYPRAPKYYIIKWLIDYVRELGIDGFRVDTAKHTEPGLWATLYEEAVKALEDWRKNNPEKKIDDTEFYMVGEVYGYSLYTKRNFDYGDTLVDFYAQDFDALINFSLKAEWTQKSPEALFSAYDSLLSSTEMQGKSVMNYITSHDDHNPLPAAGLRKTPFKSAEYLMLAPGAVQIYYGDETARLLTVEEAVGDAKLRSFMNWQELQDGVMREAGYSVPEVYAYWSKLGQFRKAHPAIGAGTHQMISDGPYTFSRVLNRGEISDAVVVTIGETNMPISVGQAFPAGTMVRNFYTGETSVVADGKVELSQPGRIYLLERAD
jgi:alpha-amylase